MSRLHIAPAMMPVESRAIVRQHFRRVCQALKPGPAAKERFSNTLKRRPVGRRFSMQKARALQVKLPPERAVVLFGVGYEARTRFPASHELPAAIRRNPASPLIGCALRARVEAARSLHLTKKQDIQIGCPVSVCQVLTKKMQSLPFSVRKGLFAGKNFAGFSLLLNQTAAGGRSAQQIEGAPKRNTTLLGGVSLWSG